MLPLPRFGGAVQTDGNPIIPPALRSDVPHNVSHAQQEERHKRKGAKKIIHDFFFFLHTREHTQRRHTVAQEAVPPPSCVEFTKQPNLSRATRPKPPPLRLHSRISKLTPYMLKQTEFAPPTPLLPPPNPPLHNIRYNKPTIHSYTNTMLISPPPPPDPPPPPPLLFLLPYIP